MNTPLDVSTKPAYVKETVALLGERDPVDVMAETPNWLREKLGNIPADKWTVPEGDGKWSLVEVISHLVDAEIAYGLRLRLIMTEANAPVTGYDQGRWLERFNYAGAEPEAALATFEALRGWNLRVWHTVTPEELELMGLHSARGPESLGLLRALNAGHDLRHRRQVERLLAVVS